MKAEYAVECGSQTSWKEHNLFARLSRPFSHPSAPIFLDTLSSLLSLQVDKVIDQVKAFASVSSCEVDVELSKMNFLRKKN